MMTQQQHQPHPSVPSPSPLHLAVKWVSGETSGVQVRCGGCSMILAVTFGVTEFICSSCDLIQMLPPELMSKVLPKPPLTSPPLPHHLVSHGIDPAKIQLPCTNCKSIRNVPHGLARFGCHQCGVDLTVDVSMLKQQIFSSLPPQLPPPPLSEDVNEVAIEVEREEDGGTVGETFTDYRPRKLSIGPSHPDPVVETSSLSAVQPPEPTYDLKIKYKLECSKALSCLQIETLVYACQRHLQHLPSGARAGFFIGDGAGVGKGRTIAGLIWENWQHGRTKALWISVGSDLKFDARRDLDDVGATCIQVHPLNKLPYSKLDSKSVGVRAGVVFLTYSSLIASSEKGRSRLQQLVQWFGPGYDGLIIFDECHKAKNLVPESGSQPTRTGVAVLDIQSRLPEARIVYCSATGASEPRNMAYMIRLGLWGYGTSFLDFRNFLVSIEKGGVGAMELVAMDMKARGMYVCRTLSYKGAEFEVVEVPLEAKMLEMFTEAAKFWTTLRIELISATDHLSNEKSTSSQLWRLYWASHQRFFRHICMSAKVPAAVRLAKEALMEDKCVVIGLQSTGEAWTEEAVTKYGLDLDDFISGPRELLLKFVEENYPMPEKPEPLPGDESVRELQRKRHSATPGVSMKGRVRKVAKLKPDSDEDSETDSALESTESDDEFQISDSALESTESDDEFENSDSALESTESDDEFQICEICNTEEGRKKLLQCSCCGRLVHPACLDPPTTDLMSIKLSCSCKEETEKNLQARLAYLAELTKRYEAASECKLNLLEKIRSMDLPNNPLDDIIDQLGGPEKVAEMTGRRGMFVRASNGKGVSYQARNTKDVTMEMVNMHEKQLFMEGKKLIAIISEAGSAGVSLQADRRAANQKRRVHLTLELPWSADRAIQQFGRTHRSNQASAPEYRLLITCLGGERRFASIVAKRLESLGALTQGDRRAGPSLSAFNYDSAYGKRALFLMYSGILEQDHLPVVPPGCSIDNPKSIEDFTEKARAALLSVGIIRDTIPGNRKIGGSIIDSDMHDVGRFLNRILGLPPDIQNRLFELFVNMLDLLVKNARDEGNLDSGIVEIKANVVELQGTPKTVHVDQMSGASTELFTFTLDRGIVWEATRTMLEGKPGSAIDGFYESKREWMGKRHFILAFESSASGMYKIVRPAVGESSREMPLAELKNKYRKTLSLDKARSGWEGEYEASSKLCMHGPNCKLGNFCTVGRRIQEVNVLGGLILPIWGTIEKALSKQARQTHKRLRVVCVETTANNQRIVGLFVPNAAVETVLQDLAWTQDLKDEASVN